MIIVIIILEWQRHNYLTSYSIIHGVVALGKNGYHVVVSFTSLMCDFEFWKQLLFEVSAVADGSKMKPLFIDCFLPFSHCQRLTSVLGFKQRQMVQYEIIQLVGGGTYCP